MKRLILAAMLATGLVSSGLVPTAEAVPPCWPGKPVNVATNLYLSPSYLLNWWNTHPVPANVANPHYYVAFHATDEYCKAHYGAGAWAVITGPSQLVSNVNGTIWGGATFNCQKCNNVAEPWPNDPVEMR